MVRTKGELQIVILRCGFPGNIYIAGCDRKIGYVELFDDFLWQSRRIRLSFFGEELLLFN
jgi:hypothetical protein